MVLLLIVEKNNEQLLTETRAAGPIGLYIKDYSDGCPHVRPVCTVNFGIVHHVCIRRFLERNSTKEE